MAAKQVMTCGHDCRDRDCTGCKVTYVATSRPPHQYPAKPTPPKAQIERRSGNPDRRHFRELNCLVRRTSSKPAGRRAGDESYMLLPFAKPEGRPVPTPKPAMTQRLVGQGKDFQRIELTFGADTPKDAINPNHYSSYAIQPIEFILKNAVPFCEANAIKYIMRHRMKNGREDIEKAIRYLQMILEKEYA